MEEKKISSVAEGEERTLGFWAQNNIFEKTLRATENNEPFVFYDGPPFATGLPHYGHLLQGILKDAVPRYRTMNGRYVRRIWGWDCHGLPIENLVEKELGLEHKKDIETYGVEKFNQVAKASVLRYDADWKKIVPRTGRWIDMDHSYKTMDWKYTESIWWAFKTLHEKGLVYEGYKPMHVCPRCETTLAASEVTLNYQDIKDISVTVKFPLVEEPGTFVLAWTTTPWTLPGNVALAIKKDIEYVKVYLNGEQLIVAKDRAAEVFKGMDHKISGEFLGSYLVGKEYLPPFDYYINDEKIPHHENGWKVYDADFVTTDTGTGVVHIAPAFGEDDMELGKAKELPFIQHVKMDGTFTSDVKDFAGIPVKKKGDTQSTDVLVLKYMAEKGTLFSKEKIEHSYPMCWRCDTPLLNYAASSWFVRVTSIREKMMEVNKLITWVPESMRDGRFGKWLEGARDWAISRSRYWGAPIPVWKCSQCEKLTVVGSVKGLRGKTPRNRYSVMRHGEAESNANDTVSSRVENPTHLTEKGRQEVLSSAEQLKEEKFDIIIASDFIRTKETAELVAEKIGIAKEDIIFDPRLREINTGVYNGRHVSEYRNSFSSFLERFTKAPEGGEHIHDVRRRALEFLFETDQKYEGKNILIVTHEYVVWMLDAGSRMLSDEESVVLRDVSNSYAATASVTPVSFIPFPHSGDYELDLHRPYIDDFEFICECGGPAKRVPEVFDCWFESGSMPYAQFHYPFENEEEFKKNFPAEFIAEAVDQTRGWFYNMLVLSVGLFERPAFENVITTGLILAEDGQKMSKKLRNYPDPMELVGKYGADALRLYLLMSPSVHGEDLNFSEKGVDELYKKMIVRLQNVVSFYEMYENKQILPVVFPKSAHVLDQWLFARLGEVNFHVTRAMEEYRLDASVRPLLNFIDDLSTWYLQNSRERLKGKDGNDTDATAARETLRYVLFEFSKVLAPFAPFIAEQTYQKTKGVNGLESVHLESWPKQDEEISDPILPLMLETKRAVSLGLEARAKAAMKVRQPLRKITLKKDEEKLFSSPAGLLCATLIAERVNVKEVMFVEMEESVMLDLEITPELKEEGMLREFMRNVQELRKKENMDPTDKKSVLLVFAEGDTKRFVSKWGDSIRKATLFSGIEFSEIPGAEVVEIEDMAFKIAVKK